MRTVRNIDMAVTARMRDPRRIRTGLWIRIHLMGIRIQHFSKLRIQIQHFSQLQPRIRIRIRIKFRIQGLTFDDLKLKKITAVKLFYIFWIENCNLLILRPP
jgi:hypothetical protein